MHHRSSRWLILPLVSFLLTASLASAADLVVTVTGIRQAKGEIGIALFSTATGFPLDSSEAQQIWLPAPDASETTIKHTFVDLPPGRYAIAVGHDLNGNRITDTNRLGIPREPWGVSNGVRPRLRAPTFAEASFEISSAENASPIQITVNVRD